VETHHATRYLPAEALRRQKAPQPFSTKRAAVQTPNSGAPRQPGYVKEHPPIPCIQGTGPSLRAVNRRKTANRTAESAIASSAKPDAKEDRTQHFTSQATITQTFQITSGALRISGCVRSQKIAHKLFDR
jgi:hypothetical protein